MEYKEIKDKCTYAGHMSNMFHYVALLECKLRDGRGLVCVTHCLCPSAYYSAQATLGAH